MPYDDSQLSAIREVITGLTSLSPAQIASRDAAVRRGSCSVALWPLWPLAETDATLWDTVSADPHITEFSVYGLFPATFDLVYGDGPPATIRYDGRTRGRVAIITGERLGQTVNVVIKPCQSTGEPEIASIAVGLGIGPAQLATIDGFISEEFIDGTFLTDLPPHQAAPEGMREIGEALGGALNRLHSVGICYNDATIADPEERSHMIVQADGSFKLIDFGVAFNLRNHPTDLTFQDVYNAARTDPMFRLFRQLSNPSDDGLGRFIDDYGRRLSAQTVAEIQARDWRIAEQGAHVIESRFGALAAGALREGLARFAPAG